MRDEILVLERASTTARPVVVPTPDEARLEIDWFKVEAQTSDCSSDDIERWHWMKIRAAQDN